MKRPIRRHSTLHRVWVGMRIGVIAAAFLSVLAIVVFVIEGPSPENVGVRIWDLIALYGSGGLIAGGIAGLLAPATRHWAGAMLIGVIAAIPVAALSLITLNGMAQWTRTDTEVMLAWSVIMGSLVGLVVWYNAKRYV